MSPRNRYTPKFERFVERHRKVRNLKLFTRVARNGQVRHFIQVPAEIITAFVRHFGSRQNILGVFSVRDKNADHMYLRIGQNCYHLECMTTKLQGTYWTMNEGGKKNPFREGGSNITERLIVLKPTEMNRLRKLIRDIEKEMKANRGKIVGRGNCVNTWMGAEIGYRKKCLADIVGISERDYSPRVMNELVDEANDRVIGVAIYPAKGNEIKRFERIKEEF